ncbi:MAG: hypothetical protein ACP5NS_02230 [Candidatus Pacearchaeota archaeon]
MRKKGEGELVADNLVPWIITIGVITLLFFLYYILSGKGNNALGWFKQIWRFGK